MRCGSAGSEAWLDSAVAVGGAGVAEGGTAVAVGGAGVAEGGTGVEASVAGTLVDVGFVTGAGGGVADGTLVGKAASTVAVGFAEVQLASPKARQHIIMVKMVCFIFLFLEFRQCSGVSIWRRKSHSTRPAEVG